MGIFVYNKFGGIMLLPKDYYKQKYRQRTSQMEDGDESLTYNDDLSNYQPSFQGADDSASNSENEQNFESQEEQNVNDIQNEADRKGKTTKTDIIKFRTSAFKMLAFVKTDLTCPYCRKKSVYQEQIHEKIIRDMIWSWCGLVREPRFICVNPKCRAYFNKHKSRMKVGVSGNLTYTHFLGNIVDFNILHIDR